MNNILYQLNYVGIEDKIIIKALQAYANPQRYYHTAYHALDICKRFFDHKHLMPLNISDKDILVSALFHDAIYNVGQEYNEIQSANFACDTITKYSKNPKSYNINHIYLSIVGTRWPLQDPDHFGSNALILRDLDIIGLSDNYNEFYAKGSLIRKEWSNVDDESFYKGQKEFFHMMLSLDNIYSTEPFIDLYEEKARSNLERYINEDHS